MQNTLLRIRQETNKRATSKPENTAGDGGAVTYPSEKEASKQGAAAGKRENKTGEEEDVENQIDDQSVAVTIMKQSQVIKGSVQINLTLAI